MTELQYSDLAADLAEKIKSGEIPPGTKLLTHRAFAEGKGVAVATATRTYKALKEKGLIVGEAGRGMFVRDPGLPPTLGIEQSENAPSVDLIFNMPSDPKDDAVLRAGLRWLSGQGDLNSMLHYQPHSGKATERKAIATYVESRLGKIDADNLLITSGGQHGLLVLVLGLLTRGDRIATDNLTYPGFKAVVGLHDLTLHPVANEASIMSPEALDELCHKRSIRAVYLTPTVSTPLGLVMAETTRTAIVEVARRHDLLIIEDGAYDFLETDPPPSFVQLAPERTVYVGSFSKIVATGLRIGFIIVPPNQWRHASMAIRASTWNTPTLITSLITHWITDGTVTEFENARRRAGAKNQALCHAYLRDIDVIAHRNASFAWLTLPKKQSAAAMVAKLAQREIALSSAEPYAVGSYTPQALRLAFGGMDDETLRDCLQKISSVLNGTRK